MRVGKVRLLGTVVAALLALLVAGASVAWLMRPAYPGDLRPTHADVAYASTSPAQVLDLFLPESPGPYPLVVNIHGGAFMMGSKEMLDAPIARALLKSGIAVASVNYRLSGEARFPAAVQDVKAAVRFLRGNAARYALDPARVLAFGQSAGGNLASMLGTTGDTREFDDPALGHADQSSSVVAVVDWFGPTDFVHLDVHAAEQGCPEADQRHGEADSPESRYLGAAVATVPELAARASPITHISARTPRFLLQKGSDDCTVPVAQSQEFYDALHAAGIPVDLDILQGAGHGDTNDRTVFLASGNVARVVAFMRGSLGK